MDAEIKVPSVENPELINVLLLGFGIGQNIAKLASPTAKNFFRVLISNFPVHSPYFFPTLHSPRSVNKINHKASVPEGIPSGCENSRMRTLVNLNLGKKAEYIYKQLNTR